jgi:hypothetical protein
MANQQQGQSSAAQQSNQTSANAAAALQASALASLLPQSTNLHQLTAALVQNSNNLKMEYNSKHDDEPTDLTTSSSVAERKYIKSEAADCYP